MDTTQLAQMVTWLDEQHRRDRTEITRLQQRLEAQTNETQEQARRIQELEVLLATARVIENDKKKKADTVQVGSTVTIKENGSSNETYTIVGAAEANPREGKISNESPMGKALLNQRAGDDVQIETPDGSYTIRIVKIG